MMMPATRGPSALPSPPSMTTANTTPTQEKICVGVSVKVSAKQTPATEASAMQTPDRSEEHTSELQSLMRISYAVFCLKKKTQQTTHTKLLRPRPSCTNTTRDYTCHDI